MEIWDEALKTGETCEPFIYTVAANLYRVQHLGKSQQLALWRMAIDLYSQEGRPLPETMQNLCREAFVENLLENDVFWGLAGPVSRDYYSRATSYLPAVYAVTALLSARRDHLPLPPDQLSLLDS